MGIKGLLPLLESIQRPTHLRNFAGQTLGVDAYGWLHRGTVACAIELAQGKPSRFYVDFAMKRVRMLLHFGVKPYIVFDGAYLPSKAHTEQERADRRRESKRLGLSLLQAGKISQAHMELQKSVDVTPLMARELIEELKIAGVEYVVAPYEADSQLAYLEKQRTISGILSEDSDLLVFGANCLITKLDQYGECVMVRRTEFTACREVSLVNWSDKEFRVMAMLSGCDYLPGIDKLGLKTAYRLVRKHKTVEQVVRNLQFDGKKKVPNGYLEAFIQAERTFLYQWVFCPSTQRLVHLNTLPDGLSAECLPYIGKSMEDNVACGVANGDLDPNTKEPLDLSTSRLPAFKRSNTVQTPDTKQGKPISEFFKPKRTPLAELDPNSFTPSPSQQRLLSGQLNTSWSTSHVSRASQTSASRPAGNLAQFSAPHQVQRARQNRNGSNAKPTSAERRLCSERLAMPIDGAAEPPTSTSQYFAKHAFAASPSLRKGTSKREAEGFELYSDDSIAETPVTSAKAIEQSLDTSKEEAKPQSPRKRKRIDIFKDVHVPGSLRQEKASQEQSQSSISTVPSQRSNTVDTAATSFSVESQGTEDGSLRKAVAFDFELLQAKCAQEERDIQADGSDSIIPASSPPRPSCSKNENLRRNDDGSSTRESRTARTPSAVLMTAGSEDLLVPESPSSNEGDGQSRPRFDLGRFAFAG